MWPLANSCISWTDRAPTQLPETRRRPNTGRKRRHKGRGAANRTVDATPGDPAPLVRITKPARGPGQRHSSDRRGAGLHRIWGRRGIQKVDENVPRKKVLRNLKP